MTPTEPSSVPAAVIHRQSKLLRTTNLANATIWAENDDRVSFGFEGPHITNTDIKVLFQFLGVVKQTIGDRSILFGRFRKHGRESSCTSSRTPHAHPLEVAEPFCRRGRGG